MRFALVNALVMSCGLAFAAASGAQEIKMPENKYSSFTSTLRDLCKKHKYVLIGDSNHASINLRRFFADTNILQAIKDCARPLVTETWEEEDRLSNHSTKYITRADKYAAIIAGKLKRIKYTPEQFGGDKKSMQLAQYEFDRLYYAALLGIPLVSPDVRKEELYSKTDVIALLQHYSSIAPITREDHAYFMLYAATIANANLDVRAATYELEKYIQRSLTDTNEKIAANILNMAPEGAVVVYGFGHLSSSRGFVTLFNEVTQKGRPPVILIKVAPEQIMAFHNPSRFNPFMFPPNYIYDLSKDTMLPVNPGSAGERAYKAMIPQYMGPEEYKAANKKINRSLRPYIPPYTEFDASQKNNVLPDNWLETTKEYKFPPVFGIR